MFNFDNGYAQSVPLLLKNWHKLKLILVGCGGTGSAAAVHIAKIAYLIKELNKKVSLWFVDFDRVEPKNIPRQNFSLAEIGLPKAQTLALRYSAAWGVEVNAICDRFNPQLAYPDWDELVVLVGAVDNAFARSTLAEAINNSRDYSSVWWLDAGNNFESGQVVLGCTENHDAISQYAFNDSNIASVLPAPSLVHPELLVPQPEESSELHMSCAQIAVINAQSIMVNQRIAVEVGDFLLRLLIAKNLRRFATYFDLATGTTQSKYICAKELEPYKASE